MDAPFKKGQHVTQVVAPPAAGEVQSVRFDENDGTFHYLITFADAEGSPQERWFRHDQIEATPEVQP